MPKRTVKRITYPLQKAGAFLRRLVARPARLPVQTPAAKLQPAEETPQETFGPGRWVWEEFTNFAGHRMYRLYIPAKGRGKTMPLLVMLHGCRQNPDDFATGTQMNALAEEFGFMVAYPGQPRSANGLHCWNWFNPRHQHRGRGEPSLVAGITRQIIDRHNADPARVYVAGLSAGGAMTAVLAATYPDLYTAVGVHSGLAHGAARNVPSAYSAMHSGASYIAPEVTLSPMQTGSRRFVPMVVFHGDRDETVHLRNASQVLQQAWPHADTLLRHDQSQHRVAGGHSYTCTRYCDQRRRSMAEFWQIHDMGHAWSGGNEDGSYTDAKGPDASRELIRFFLSHKLKIVAQTEETVS